MCLYLWLAGLRHWIGFIEAAYGCDSVAFPPTLSAVLEWSSTFRCVGTFCNYLGHLRAACYAMDIDAPPVGHPALRRAMSSIVKRRYFVGRCVSVGFCCGNYCS